MKDTIIHIRHSARTIAASQHGSVLIYIVAVILIAGVLGLGIVSMTTTSAFTGLGYNPSDQARFLAKSGMNYAVERGEAEPKYLVLDEGKIEIEFDDVGPGPRYDITAIATVLEGTYREASFKLVRKGEHFPGPPGPPGNGPGPPGNGEGNNGVVIIVDDEGNETEVPFSNVINTTEEDPDWVELIITSSVGTQEYDNFDFYAPEGITIEEGVEFISDSAQGSINLESDTGDIVIEPGVIFSSDSSANNETEEIYIKTCGSIYISGADLQARRYIYLEAGENIYAQSANLTVSSNSRPNSDIVFVINEDCTAPAGDIFVYDLFMEFGANNKDAIADPCMRLDDCEYDGDNVCVDSGLRAGSAEFDCN